MRPLASLFAVSILLLGVALWPACSPTSVQVGARVPPPRAQEPRPWRPARLECARPRTLELRRFEDGSAWLRCDGRLLARIAVPR